MNGQKQEQTGQKAPAFFKRRDVQIILAIVVVALALFFFLPKPAPGATDGEVIIYTGETEYRRVPLGEPTSVLVEQTGGRVNEIAITENGVYMSRSTCQNQDCVKQGDITLDNYQDRPLGTFIVCLPNQVSIELAVEEDK